MEKVIFCFTAAGGVVGAGVLFVVAPVVAVGCGWLVAGAQAANVAPMVPMEAAFKKSLRENFLSFSSLLLIFIYQNLVLYPYGTYRV